MRPVSGRWNAGGVSEVAEAEVAVASTSITFAVVCAGSSAGKQKRAVAAITAIKGRFFNG
jgi:hypothetical protein